MGVEPGEQEGVRVGMLERPPTGATSPPAGSTAVCWGRSHAGSRLQNIPMFPWLFVCVTCVYGAWLHHKEVLCPRTDSKAVLHHFRLLEVRRRSRSEEVAPYLGRRHMQEALEPLTLEACAVFLLHPGVQCQAQPRVQTGGDGTSWQLLPPPPHRAPVLPGARGRARAPFSSPVAALLDLYSPRSLTARAPLVWGVVVTPLHVPVLPSAQI